MENNNYILSIPIIRPVNHHDSMLLSDALENLRFTIDFVLLDTYRSYLTLDSGFDGGDLKTIVYLQELIPVIKPNARNCGDEKRYTILDSFAEIESIYKERYRIERNFAWKSKYRKLVTRYEKLQCIHLGFRCLAYTMINYREIFNKNSKNPK